MKLKARIGWNIRKLRVARQMTQEALSGEANVDLSYVARLEGGAANPSADILERFAKALGVDAGEFFRIPSPGERAPAPLPSGRKKK